LPPLPPNHRVLAGLGLEWEKIRGTYGGWTVELLRNIEARIENVSAAGAAQGIPEPIQTELDSIREEVKSLTPAPRPDFPTVAAHQFRLGKEHDADGCQSLVSAWAS
jgi:hypothetical protein